MNVRYEAKGPPCACGCGRRVAVYRWADRHNNRAKGAPVRFLDGHQHRVHRPDGHNFHEPGWFLRRQA